MSKIEHVVYNRDDVWEYGGQYVDGRFTSRTLKLIRPIDPPTDEYLAKKESQRQECYKAYKTFGEDSEEYKEAAEIYYSPV